MQRTLRRTSTRAHARLRVPPRRPPRRPPASAPTRPPPAAPLPTLARTACECTGSARRYAAGDDGASFDDGTRTHPRPRFRPCQAARLRAYAPALARSQRPTVTAAERQPTQLGRVGLRVRRMDPPGLVALFRVRVRARRLIAAARARARRCASVRVRACVHAYVRAHARARTCACVSVRARTCAYVRVRVRACACVRLCAAHEQSLIRRGRRLHWHGRLFCRRRPGWVFRTGFG